MSRRILFVDDEKRVLDGLKRMLRSMRREWDMHFASSAAEALELLRQHSFDVVVSDMRMPGMDGAQFLTEVMNDFPQVARLALSGQADEQLILRSVRPVHQYLSKPCESEALKATIHRVCSLRDRLQCPILSELVSQLKTIPSRPTLYAKIVEELESEEPSIQQVGEIISSDLGMTAKILHMVNSAFFGLRRHVSNPSHAVNLLGLDTVKNLVLSIQVFASFDAHATGGFSIDKLWRHSMNTARFAQRICMTLGLSEGVADDAFGAGMLHDVGKVILATNLPAEYQQVLSFADSEGIPDIEAEQQILGADHAQVGAHLLGLWGLPDPFVEAVAFHHAPKGLADEQITALTAVHVANVLDQRIQPPLSRGLEQPLDDAHLRLTGIADRIPEFEKHCRALDDGAPMGKVA